MKAQQLPDKLMSGAEPLFIEGNETGFLFIHGFTAAPYEGREIAKRLYDELGYTVAVPLLPGHGTTPEDMKSIEWMDWYLFVRDQYFDLKKHCSRIIVCGQSMGGALALHLASHHPVDAVVTLAAAVFLKDWRLKLLPVARHLITYQHKSKGPDIKNKALKSQVPSYPKYPVKSVDQLLGLVEHTRQDLAEVTAPILLVHSRNDRTVHFDNMQYIYDHVASPRKEKLVLENSYHVISIDFDKDLVYESIAGFVKDIL